MLLLVVAVSCSRSSPAPPPTSQTPRMAVASPTPAQVVEEFGRRLKNVSTLAPPEQVRASIRSNYAELADSDLLQQWLDDPAGAPGRAVSSPWPDRIEVTGSSEPSPGVVRVTGRIVEVSSAGEAAREPATLELKREEGAWRITSYSAEPAARAERLSDDQKAAVQVVRDYYDAIAARDYARAWREWGANGPPGQTREQFRAGFRDTKSVAVETGTPSRVEPAAGSRYVRVPVVVTATTASGERQRFSGSYTLRRSVVDGATAAQRRWHIDGASLRPGASGVG